jgi:Domain of unknown function (DUF3883)
MTKAPAEYKSATAKFEDLYDRAHEDYAARVRGEFLQKFSLKRLANLEVDDYVIGLQSPTFCTYVEVKTRPWANIQGATADKFGIYFGKTKYDQERKYRFAAKFGATPIEAFESVKTALLNLVQLGMENELDFQAIDSNPLSQMFKAKILSLYFPDKFLNVCSADHLLLLGSKLNLGANRPKSEYQHLLLKKKSDDSSTRHWSNPKFMEFLYAYFVKSDVADVAETLQPIQKPRKKAHRKVNFEDIQAQRDAIGRAAEEFALQWEKERLEGAELSDLIAKIEDKRDRPGNGYDFLSHSARFVPRFIEVKSVRRLPNGEGLRFFLSENEHLTSKSDSHRDEYFFYLVLFDGDSNPVDLKAVGVEDMYNNCEMQPASYVVRFDIQ